MPAGSTNTAEAAPGRITVAPSRPASWWCELVAQATDAIAAAGPDGLRTVVLAREVMVQAAAPFHRAAILARLRAPLPRCCLYLVDSFLGPSPELLVACAGHCVSAPHPAGTHPPGGPDGLRSVWLAREFRLEAAAPVDRAPILARLRATFPGCFLYLVDGFLGASPELLVSRSGDVVRAQPMAGTAPRGGDPTSDARLGAALLSSPTYRHEHQITIDMVHDTLLPWCSYLDYEAEPSVVGVANVQHLATLVEGRLSQPTPSVLELVDALHPTPAVSGWPRDLANEWILAHEGFDRGRYAGAVGWVDAAGNGTWAVSIRGADVDGTTARVCAGNGIVADSDPQTELRETQSKLQALLNALVRV